MAIQTAEEVQQAVPAATDRTEAPHGPTRRCFTVDEYYRMAEVGILAPDERLELIEGDIIAMSPIGGPHANAVRRASKLFTLRLVDRAEVSAQNPIRLSARAEPQPDLALLRPREAGYPDHPRPEDVLLVVEVADTSLAHDRRVKVPLHARLSIPELWVEDLNGGVLEVYRRPEPAGYADFRRLKRGERVAPAAFPDVELAVEDLLG